jgi:hypothetical protein
MAMYRSDEERMKRIEDKLDALQKQGLPAARMFGYEYKSDRTILGMPLVHVAQGLDPATGRPRVARGFVAIGNIAIGVFALGGIALGGVALGGFSLGLLALGGMALGVLLGAGGMAVGCVALGGMAVGYYALGGMALGVHALGGNVQDPALLKILQDLYDSNFRTRP